MGKEFDAGGYLSSKGLTVTGPGEADGQYMVQTPDGKQVNMDVMGYLKSKGVPVDKLDLSFNSPKTAIDVSPVDIEDRLKMSVGNAAGSIAYLKNKFDDVKYDPDKGLTVKQKGMWHQVDPSGWGGGNAWDKTKEIIKDGADLLDVGINVGTTAAATSASALATLGTGTVGGALVGGAASGAIRTSLGRAFGTYQASPEEQLSDIGLEALLNAGGQAIANGVQPRIGQIANAVKSFASDASDTAKSAMSGILQKTAKITPESADLLMKDAPMVMGHLDRAAAIAKTSTDGLKTADVLVNENIGAVKGVLSGARKALSANFDPMEKELLASVPKSFTAVPGDVVRSTLDPLVEQGVLTPIYKGADNQVLAGYKLADKETIMSMLEHPESSPFLVKNAMNKFNDFVKLGNEFIGRGPEKGAAATESLIGIRRAFDDFYFTATRANPDLKEVLTPMSSQMRDNLVKTIESASKSVAEKYKSMNSFYQAMLPHVAEAERIVGTASGKGYNNAEAFLGKLASGAGDNRTAKNLLDAVASLNGDAGEAAKQGIKARIAASEFISRMPQVGLKGVGAAGVIGAGAHATGTGGLALLAVPPAAALSSPRFMGRSAQAAQSVLPYAQKLGDFLKTIPPDQMKQLIGHPDAFANLVRTTVEQAGMQEKTRDQLLQQAGVGPRK